METVYPLARADGSAVHITLFDPAPSAPPQGGSSLPSRPPKRSRSQRAGIGLGWLGLAPARRGLQRLDRAGPVQVNDRVELLGHPSMEVVAGALGRGPVDDAD